VVERRWRSTPPPHRPAGLAKLLQELARQFDDGRVYDRDIPSPTGALDAVLEAYRRRAYVRARAHGGAFADPLG
jgi:hypothetical protein